MAHMNKAIDQVRTQEARRLQADGYVPHLKGMRYCLLKRPENLTESQEVKLADLLRYNLKSVRAYLLKEDFQGVLNYVSPAWAGKFLDRWCTHTMRSEIEPMNESPGCYAVTASSCSTTSGLEAPYPLVSRRA